MKDYTDQEFNYSLKYPNDWDVGERQLDVAVIFRAPSDEISPNFLANVNISIQDLSFTPEIRNLENFTVFSLAQLDEMITNFTIKEKTRSCTINGNPGYQILYTGELDDLKLKFKQIWTIKGETAYVLTYTATQKQFDIYREIADSTLDSFKFR